MQVQNKPVPMMEKNAVAQKKDAKTEKTTTTESQGSAQASNSKEAQSTKEQTSTYLKVISRLEKVLKEKGSAPEKAIKGFAKAIEIRLKEMQDQEKKSILLIPEAKAMEIKSLEDLPEKVETALMEKTPEGREKVLELLKQPQFAELMDSKKEKAQTYEPPKGGKGTPPEIEKTAKKPTQTVGKPENKEDATATKKSQPMDKAAGVYANVAASTTKAAPVSKATAA